MESVNPPPVPPIVYDAVKVADRFWTDAGYTMPRVDIRVVERDPNTDAAAYADMPGTRVYIVREWVESLNRLHDPSVFDRIGRRDELTEFCKTMVHERGHNLGLAHDDREGIMDTQENQATPAACVRWATVKTPKPRKPARPAKKVGR